MIRFGSKYGNKKSVYDGITFDSKAELNRYLELKMLEKAGLVDNLKLQPEFVLQVGFVWEGKKIREIKYIADFMYFDVKTRETVVEDVKGFPTTEFKLKLKMLYHKFYLQQEKIKIRIIYENSCSKTGCGNFQKGQKQRQKVSFVRKSV